jgi:hypothetical protein
MKKVFLVLLLATTVAHAETYKWTDREDTVHFSESLSEVPAQYRKSAEPLGMDTHVATPGNKTASPAAPRQGTDDKGGVAPQVEELKGRMMNDEGTMSLIRALQDDPEMRALLNDPAVMSAILSGDTSTLKDNPVFLKMLNNPRVREIGKRMQ